MQGVRGLEHLPAPAPEEPMQGVRVVKPLTDQRIRSQCKECGGASICPHKRQRSRCKECRGSVICQHQRRRSTGKECRKESDEVMSDGLEELVEGTYRTAAGPKLWAPPRRKAASHLQGHRLGA